MPNRTLACSVLLAFALAPLGAQPGPGKEELKLKLPKPMFIGTPTNLRSPNLEKITGKSRGPFYVPTGTVLLSLKKKVTSSDSAAGHRRAGHDHGRREERRRRLLRRARSGPQWVQIDLGASHALSRHPALALSQPGARLPRRRRPGVRRSGLQDGRDDGLQQRPRQLRRSSGPGTDKEYIEVAEGRLIDPKGVKGRYVRLYSNGNTTNDLNHYVEVEVYGTPK